MVYAYKLLRQTVESDYCVRLLSQIVASKPRGAQLPWIAAAYGNCRRNPKWNPQLRRVPSWLCYKYLINWISYQPNSYLSVSTDSESTTSAGVSSAASTGASSVDSIVSTGGSSFSSTGTVSTTSA